MMLAVTDYGTARGAHNDDWPVLGKTGTVRCRQATHNEPVDLAWFVGACPPQDPKRCVAVVMLSRQSLRYMGGTSAAVIAGRIFDRLREAL
jgi:cell division protein FtsI/penicillin-binding protein 2